MSVIPVEKPRILTSRWTELRPHDVQSRLWHCGKRFRVVPAGRRSGKSELAKRWLILEALKTKISGARYIFAAPTQGQAKSIYWEDVKKMVPQKLVWKVIESDPQTIILVNGAAIIIAGMDRPQRVEGAPIDGIVLDEYADMKPHVWTRHLRPALDTEGREGWAWLIGVPEGRNHYYRLWKQAISNAPGWEDWGGFTWTSADILSPDKIASAKASLDEITFRQEYEASFESYTGRAYDEYAPEVHSVERLNYMPGIPLDLCFDFNISPGIAVVCQEQPYQGKRKDVAPVITAVIGEVHIPRNSTTKAVCKRLMRDWGEKHSGEVNLFGDASGGAGGSAKISGSDWDIIHTEFRKAPQWELASFVPKANPNERPRVNAMNRRLRTVDGEIRMLLDPVNAKHTGDDLDAVVLLEGGTGEIDKKATPEHTHLTDALGYRIEREFGVNGFRREKYRGALR